jgi:hypothetical protein
VQIELDEDGNRVISENYIRIEWSRFNYLYYSLFSNNLNL